MPRIVKASPTGKRSWHPLLACVCVVACMSTVVWFDSLKLGAAQNDLDLTRLLLRQEPSRKSKLADGCYHVFLDVGANIGIHTRFLFEPDKYPHAKNAHLALDAAFGGTEIRDPRDLCAFGFEPNPGHRKRQASLQKAYEAMGWRYFPIEAAVGDTEDSSITFFHNEHLLNTTEWGFSVVDREKRGIKEVVPSIHFSKWIEKEIMGRQMPAKVYGKYGHLHSHQGGLEGKVAMKLDVEGMEFLVAPSLIFSGVMCKAIDVAWGEFHDSGHIPVRPPMDVATGQGELPAFENDWHVPQNYFMTLWKAMKSMNPQDCRARWLDLFDQEDYVYDGIPFPTPTKTLA